MVNELKAKLLIFFIASLFIIIIIWDTYGKKILIFWFIILIIIILYYYFTKYHISSNSFVNKVVLEIRRFKPDEKNYYEEHYQKELNGYLKHTFPNIKTEIQTQESRPDIIIKDLAIEIKGLTKGKELDSVFGKLYRYIERYKYIIIVLFCIQAKKSRMNQFERGLKKYFPKVILIKK